MNETLYEAKCEYSFDVVKEMTIHTRKTAYTIYCAVLYAILLVIELRYVFVYHNLGFSIFIAIILIGTGIMFFQMPRINAKRQYRSMKDMYEGENMRTKIYVYEDGIEHINMQTDGHIQIKYPEIIKQIETKRLFILMLKGNIAVVMMKELFTKGEPESFRNFISMKTAK